MNTTGDSAHWLQGVRPWDDRAILHVDLDAFFAAVEQLDNPDLRGRPVIVGGDPAGRGVVATCSYEARAFGIRSAMPSARAAALCPDAVWVRGRFERYREMSACVFALLREESPSVQTVSIDEAFLDVTPGAHGAEHPVAVAARIRERIRGLGITGSAGLSTSKTVSKIASDHRKPDGLTVVWPGEEASFLAPLPVTVLSGVGPKTAARLMVLGVTTLGALSDLDEATARHLIGSRGPELIARARGVDPRPVVHNDPVKQMSAERTFSEDVRSALEMERALADLGERVGRRMRKAGVVGSTVQVKLRMSDFTTHTLRHALPRATDDEHDFVPVALALVRSIWTPGTGIRLIGVGITGFGSTADQMALPESAEAESDLVAPDQTRQRMLVRQIDEIRSKFGEAALLRGAASIHERMKDPLHDSGGDASGQVRIGIDDDT